MKLKMFFEPVLDFKSFEKNGTVLMSNDFSVQGDYDPNASWLD